MYTMISEELYNKLKQNDKNKVRLSEQSHTVQKPEESKQTNKNKEFHEIINIFK